ncbi:uncharacterized protein RB166_001582 [Leptodactylus fuscus]|uniref:uncharacterized protein LOC142193979 n=1 Tax=Leptodactylus fuscus TaxID=238119 RepID=UPI003F4F11FE
MDMEIPFMDHVRHSLLMDENKDVIIDKLLNLTLEIICLLTGEDYIVVRKSAEKRGRRVVDKCSEAQGLRGSPRPPVTEETPAQRTLEPAKNNHSKAEKLLIKSEDAEICAWDYSAEQKDAMAVSGPERRCSDTAHGTESPPRKCRTPLCSQDSSTLEYQADPPGDGIFHQQYKEETAIPDVTGSGGDDSSDPQEPYRDPACSEDLIEEDNQMITPYQSDVGDEMFHQPCKEEAGYEEVTSGPAVSSLDVLAIRHFPNRSDRAACHKSSCADNPLSCSICGVRFTSEMTFAAHQRFHTEEKSYDCTYCGKSFNQRSRLLSHKRKHTGEKPFSCPVCGRCFAERSALVTHQRIHSGEKPFNCSECARSFVQRSSLVKHQRIHTGERPFVCSQCGRCFSQSSNLVRHQRILHQVL